MVEQSSKNQQESDFDLNCRLTIFSAVHKNKSTPIMQILQGGYPVDKPVQDPEITPLMLAASLGTAKVVKAILKSNPDVNAIDTVGRTALHYACRRGDIEIFKVLMEDTDVNEDAQTKAGVSPMMMAVQSGNIHLLAECLNSNMNPFLEDGLGQTALDYAKQFPD